jgi:hypothetical protein
VFGRRPATAAHDADVVQHEAPGIRRHVLRGAQIQIAPLDVTRAAGVGLRRELEVRRRGHAFDSLEHRCGTDRAVDADDRRASSLELGSEPLGRGPIQGIAVLFGRHLSDDRPVGHAADRIDRGADLVEIAERFEDEEIDAPFGERARLLGEGVACLVHARLTPRLDPDPQWADRAGDICAVARRPPGDERPLEVDGVQLIGEAEGRELDAVGAECVGFDDVCPGADVLLVNLAHQRRRAQVERVEALVDEHALGVQHRAHRSIAHEDTGLQGLNEWIHELGNRVIG